MADDNARRNRRVRLRAWHWVALVVVLLVGLVAVLVLVHRNQLDRRLAALRAAGYPTSFAELAEYNRLPEGAPNAAEIYERAFAAFVPPVDDVNTPRLGQAVLPERGAPLPEAMSKAIAECLAANRECLSLLHEAAGIKDCRYDWDYAGSALPGLADFRKCAQLLQLAALAEAEQGHTDAAITCIKDGLRLSDSLRREPMLINYLVRIAAGAVALSSLERALNVTPFTDGQLQELSGILAERAGQFDLAEAIITERCLSIEYARDPSRAGGLGAGGTVLRLPGVRGMGLVDILDHMGSCVEAARLPLTERVARFREIGAELNQLSFLHVTVKVLAPSLVRVTELDLRFHAHLDLARTALALERYRLATGTIPDRLEQLVPQYLEQVPIDPFDGRPLRYRRTNPGYVLYSIMEDGQDNGGRERDDVMKGEPYDWCFIVTR
jgi:tetratricopeptide (TPR) repeat protein